MVVSIVLGLANTATILAKHAQEQQTQSVSLARMATHLVVALVLRLQLPPRAPAQAPVQGLAQTPQAPQTPQVRQVLQAPPRVQLTQRQMLPAKT